MQMPGHAYMHELLLIARAGHFQQSYLHLAELFLPRRNWLLSFAVHLLTTKSECNAHPCPLELWKFPRLQLHLHILRLNECLVIS